MVDLCIDSVLDPAMVKERLLSVLKARQRALKIEIREPKGALPLFRADAWFDECCSGGVVLLVALQLRRVTSEVLANGVAEAGSILIVSSPSLAGRLGQTSPVYLHRPAKGRIPDVASTLALAVRWGRTAFDRIGAIWRTGLTEDSILAIRSSSPSGRTVRPIDLDATVGNAGVARAWLAATLAVESAALTNAPQLVIAQEGDVLTALMCETKI